MEKVPWVVGEAAVVGLEELDLESSFDSACAGLASSCFAELVCSEGVGVEADFVQGVIGEVVEVIEAFVVAVVDVVVAADAVVGGADVVGTDAAVAAAVAAAAVETYWGRV